MEIACAWTTCCGGDEHNPTTIVSGLQRPHDATTHPPTTTHRPSLSLRLCLPWCLLLLLPLLLLLLRLRFLSLLPSSSSPPRSSSLLDRFFRLSRRRSLERLLLLLLLLVLPRLSESSGSKAPALSALLTCEPPASDVPWDLPSGGGEAGLRADSFMARS